MNLKALSNFIDHGHFKNGRDTHVERTLKKRRLHVQAGLQRCLLHSSSVERSLISVTVEHKVGVCLSFILSCQ